VSGGFLLGLIGISMASLFAIAGLVMNFQVWRAARHAKPGEQLPSAIPILPGVVGSVTLFFLIPQLSTRFGVEVPWPFLWILLPLVVDLQGLGGLLLALAGLGRSARPRSAPPGPREPSD